MADEQSQDQAAMQQSTSDQVPEAESVVEQPTQDSNTQREDTVEVNGETIPIDELKAGYMRQKDYTQKTQALAEERRAREQAAVQLDPEVERAAQVLKQVGFVTQEDLARQKAAMDDEAKFQKILSENPDLRKEEKRLRAIGMSDNRAWEDIIHDYDFKPKTALNRARSSDKLVGSPIPKIQPKGKSVGQMSSDEYREWKKANLKGSTF